MGARKLSYYTEETNFSSVFSKKEVSENFFSASKSTLDYYPFGMLLPNRHESTNEYRYGFQGQEKDDEIKGEGNSVNYKYRMHDPRIGRFFAIDPLTSKYPHYSPYSFSGNKVIHAIELEGLEEHIITTNKTKLNRGLTVKVVITYVKASDRTESSPGADDKNREVDYIVDGANSDVHSIPENTWEYEQVRRQKRTMDEYGNNNKPRTLGEAVESGNIVTKGDFSNNPEVKGDHLRYWYNISIENTYNDFKILYDTNDDQIIGADEDNYLGQTASILNTNSNIKVRIIGSTSRKGSASNNMNLSIRRAKRIKDKILRVAKQKGYDVDSMRDRISVIGLGESRSHSEDGTDNPKERKTYIQFK